jgi:hypothetical protein
MIPRFPFIFLNMLCGGGFTGACVPGATFGLEFLAGRADALGVGRVGREAQAGLKFGGDAL